MSKNKYRANSLTWEEQERLYKHTYDLSHLVLFRLAISTGIRRDDIANILVRDIDLKASKIRFWESKKNREWEVPILESVKPDLIRYLNTMPKSQKFLFMFTGRSAYNHLQRALKRAGINKDLSFHDLRRTCTKNMFSKKVNPNVACAILGDTLSTLQTNYDNYTTEEAKEEMEAKGL